MKTFEVWVEGYRVTGSRGRHFLLGDARAETFRQACELLIGDSEYYDSKGPTYLSCRLFDNASDARKAFG